MLKDFIAFDIEEPNQHVHSISAIGISVVRNCKITERFYTLVNPETGFEPYVIKLTGITPKMVIGKPAIEDIWPKIEPYFTNGDVIVAHGALCDLMNLSLALDRYCIEPDINVRYLCTADLSSKLTTDIKSHSLSSLCERFEIPLNAHNAQSDSDGCAQLLINYVKQGHDCERYIVEDNLYDIASRQRVQELNRRIKNIHHALKQKKGGHVPFSTRRFNAAISEASNSREAGRIEKNLQREVSVFGTDDETINQFAKQIPNGQIETIMQTAYFEVFEYYKLYSALTNRTDPSFRGLVKMLSFLPCYAGLNCMNYDTVMDVLEENGARDLEVVQALLEKQIGFGCHALGIKLICFLELYNSDPEFLLDILKYTKSYPKRYFKDEDFKYEYFQIWHKLSKKLNIDAKTLKKTLGSTGYIAEEVRKQLFES